MSSGEPPNEDLEPALNTQGEQSLVQIELTPEFQQNLRNLAKRYRSIRSDVQVVIQELQTLNLSQFLLKAMFG